MPSSFEHLKQVLCKEPIFQYPSTEKPYTLFTDTNHYAYSGLLIKAVESPHDLRPVTSMLGSFLEIQQKWSISIKEVYEGYQSVLMFDLHLCGAKCVLFCNHKPLEPFLSKVINNP